jgi:hypothetical protein
MFVIMCTGGGGVKTAAANIYRVHPPDKKKFEKETAEITHRIKELEAKLVSFFTKSCVVQIP